MVLLTLTVMAERELPFRARIEAPTIHGLVEGEHLAVLIDVASRRVELDPSANSRVGSDTARRATNSSGPLPSGPAPAPS